MSKKERKRRSYMLVVGATVGTAGLIACALLGFLDPFVERAASHPFDPKLWQTGSLRQRGRMARDLESSEKLIGLSRDEVLALLGPPDRDDGPASVAYTVDIGYKFGFEPWTYCLTIRFGKTDARVKEVVLHD